MFEKISNFLDNPILNNDDTSNNLIVWEGQKPYHRIRIRIGSSWWDSSTENMKRKNDLIFQTEFKNHNHWYDFVYFMKFSVDQYGKWFRYTFSPWLFIRMTCQRTYLQIIDWIHKLIITSWLPIGPDWHKNNRHRLNNKLNFIIILSLLKNWISIKQWTIQNENCSN